MSTGLFAISAAADQPRLWKAMVLVCTFDTLSGVEVDKLGLMVRPPGFPLGARHRPCDCCARRYAIHGSAPDREGEKHHDWHIGCAWKR